MCLYKSIIASEKFLLRRRRHNFIYAYKILFLKKDERSLESPHFGMTYRPGYNRCSNKDGVKYNPAQVQVTQGIHVYTNYKISKKVANGYNNAVTVQVKCLVHDFLGKSDGGGVTAAFSKVFISKAEYAKALQTCLKRRKENLLIARHERACPCV